MSACSPSASLGFFTRGVVRESVGSGRSIWMSAVDAGVRVLTGIAEAADKDVEMGADAVEPPTGVISGSDDFTAPEDFSSRTIASTIAFNLVSSINSLQYYVIARAVFFCPKQSPVIKYLPVMRRLLRRRSAPPRNDISVS